MRRGCFFSIIFVLTIVVQTDALTLTEAYELAIQNRSSVREAELDKEIGAKLHTLALSNSLPKLSLIGDADWQDRLSSTSSNAGIDSKWRRTGRLNFEQPLFQGGRTYFGLSLANAEQRKRQHDLEQARLDLYLETTESFISTVISQSEMKNLKEQQRILLEQITYLERQSAIGKVRETDLVATQSEHSQSVANLIDMEDQLQAHTKQLEWLIGTALDTTLTVDLELPNDTEARLKTLNLDKNPTLLSVQEELKSQRDRVFVSRADFLPQLDLEGNYNFYRAGTPSRSDWDLGFQLTWEFFGGFSTHSQVSIEKYEVQKLKASLADTRRRLKSEFAAAKKSVLLQSKRVNQLKAATHLAEKAYQLQKNDYDLDLVSNLDVLRSLENYINIKRLYDRAKLQNQLLWIKAQLLTGQLP